MEEHLDTAISILKGGNARRGRGTTFTLYVNASRSTPGECEGILQGPRGKTVATFWGDALEVQDKARAHVARLPGATLTIYND